MSYGNFGGSPENRYPPDWMCISCGHVNFARRSVCEQCGRSRTADAPPAYAPTHASVRAGTVSATSNATGFKAGLRPSPFAFSALPAYSQGARQPMVLMPGDWCCPSQACGHLNFAKRTECQVCKTPKNFTGPRGGPYGMTGMTGSPLGGYSPDWKCLQCDNINFARRTECKQCGAPRTASSPATHVSQQYAPDWRCTSCGNINFARRTECKQCSKPRTADAQPAFAPNHAALKASQQIRGYGGPKTVIMGPGDWTCPSCGFMNFARRVECLQCKTDRPSSLGGPMSNPRGGNNSFPYTPY
jgi:uncharacterized OB-fold protein|eukprot:CAMPEP_0174295274 /NCGR_PEP_ID=MMETSP0809-20121228/44253_1 /TAXON_ID=73025 ORGANISM="Eutreptiella gymnastica-like, Strain CCMP1594" /NCGR_SAMPLE_ID=MMETSP0809 /ASSEMBLY_ACC=CAM_ASM_000658 /LENGTH=300 /DNA_ID=CAMNT_0015397431 /DNA_START=18 /DNA_END=920 /DNA_ORIENTATION=-